MTPLFDRPFTFDRVSRIVISVITIAILIYVVALLRNVLLPFLIGWLLAYLMQPFVKFFQYRLKFKSRVLAIAAVIVSLLLILGLAFLIVVPSIMQEVDKTLELIRTQSPGKGYIPFIPESWQLYIRQNLNIDLLLDILNKENFQNAIKEIAPKLWLLLSNTFSILFSITIVFIIGLYFIFILLDYEKISNGWITLIPDKYRPFIHGLASDVESSMNRYFRGQSLVALCVGVLLAIGFRLIGFPLAITLGLFIGVLNLIPYLQVIGLIPMILLSLLKSAQSGENFWIILGMAVLVLVVVQCIQDLVLVPRIMGKAMGLNPAIILLSLSIWGTLLGFVGLIIALPLTTLCLSYYKRFMLTETKAEAEAEATQEPKPLS
ncbi:MAG: AI-2E family transporter [Tannerellaceae bacterium]|jgi:predicted PurR-regulated permease PerM|nr:AI-2E family transporter [Tannerellaceae bacterium]